MRRLGALVVGVLVLAGCSGSDNGDDAADGTTTTTTAAVEETTTTTTEPAGEPSAGCGVEPDVEPVSDELPGDVEQTFTSGGVERAYRLGIPADYDPDVPTPLILNLHGSGSNAAQASTYGDVPRQAAAAGMITVAAEAIGGIWGLGDGADTDFLTALLDDVEGRYCIDLDHVHGVGNSLGAAKTAFFACTAGDRFASLALVTVEVFANGCKPMPVVAFHGTADPVVAYGEGGGSVDAGNTPNQAVPGTLSNIANWAENGGCDPEPVEEMIGDDVEHRTYEGCDEGVGVELYTILGGGHTWPGSAIDIGPPEWTTDTISATELMLTWFADHPRT